jgi:hypothetical protein
MGGIKHNLFQYGMPGNMGAQKGEAVFLNGASDFERQIAAKAVNQQPYCKHCGQFIYGTSQDEEGRTTHPEWELMNNAHFKCASAAEAKRQEQSRLAAAEYEAKRQEEEAQREEAAKTFDWEAYMKETMKRDEE